MLIVVWFSFHVLMQEVVTGARLVKRMSFALLSGEMDQYVSFLPDIQGMYAVKSVYMLQVCLSAIA